MKKLLVTAIGAAAAFGAFADYTNAQRFEGMTVGPTDVSTLGSYWSELPNSTNTYAIVEMDAGGQTINHPDAFKNETDPANALSVKTTFGKPLSFNVLAGGAATNLESNLFFDSLVKFTVCEDVPADSYENAKIIMWLQEAQDASGNATGTNLMVRAGYLADGGVVATNYTCGNAISADFADKWHRVTIKAMRTISSGATVPGFAIFIDGGNNTMEASSDDPKWDTAPDLTEAAEHYGETKLFPSLIQDSDDTTKLTLTSASFDGTGTLNDMVFTSVTPGFTEAEDYVAPKASVTINGSQQTGIVTLADAIDAANGAAANAAVVITLAKGFDFDAPVTIAPEAAGVSVVLDFNGFVIENTGSECLITNSAALTVTDSSGGATGGIVGPAIYQSDEATELTIAGGNFWGEIAAGELAEFTISGGAFSQAGGDLELLGAQVAEGKMISETKNADNLYPVVVKVNYVAQIGQQGYESFAAALAAAADGDTITLLDNVTAAPFTINVAQFGDQGLTIDLGGFTYTFDGGSGDGIYLLSSNKLTIANGTLAAASGMAYRDLVRDYNSVLTLNNVTVDGTNFPAADGTKLACLICVEGGGANIIGNTSIINVKPAAYAIKMGNHAQAWYEMGTTTVNTTGNIMGNVLIAGGVYNEVAVGSGSTINYYYGKNVHSSWEDGVSSANFAARLGTLPTAAGTQDNVSGQLFKTLQAAVDAAQANDTVTVVADSTISTPLSIAKNITVHNDFTITGAVNYAICIGATVSFEGTGKIERASNISGSAFCVGANETTRGAITAGTAGTLNFDGLTVCGGSGGNLIKLENGTVNMNGGVLRDGKRGIKADADVGAYTSAIVINGGTITNNTDCAIMASAASADGTATVVVNGGVIAGALVYDGTAGTYSITIPSTSTAKFNADQSAFCAEGYETTQDSDGWYVVTAVPPPAPSGIDPASATPSAEVTAESDTAAIAAVEVTTPTEAGSTPEAKAAYKDLFTYTAVETSAGSGVYTVTLTGIKETVQEAVSKDAVDVLTSDEATVDVPAGLCYKVTTYTALGGAAVETKSGTSDGTAIPVAKPGTTQGFIKVELATKPLN